MSDYALIASTGLILCPEYFDGRLNGIGRVSEAVVHCLESAQIRTVVWSANESNNKPVPPHRSFNRRYLTLMMAAFLQRPAGLGLLGAMHLGLSPAVRVAARRRPYFVFVHGIEAWRPLRPRAHWGMQGARVLIFNSEFTRTTFLRHNPSFVNRPAAVIPLGVPDIGEGTEGERGKQILCVSRLSKTDAYKNIRVLLDAWERAQVKLPYFRLKVVGDGDDRLDLEQYARTRPRSLRVDFTGRVSDEQLHLEFRRSRLFVLPSENEGFGLVFAEAASAGLPTICGDRDAAREVVIHGTTGLAVDPRSISEIANALVELASDEYRHRKMSSASREHYARCFTLEAFRERLEKCLRAHQVLPEMRGCAE